MKFLEENSGEYLYKMILNFFLQRIQNTINIERIKLM